MRCRRRRDDFQGISGNISAPRFACGSRVVFLPENDSRTIWAIAVLFNGLWSRRWSMAISFFFCFCRFSLTDARSAQPSRRSSWEIPADARLLEPGPPRAVSRSDGNLRNVFLSVEQHFVLLADIYIWMIHSSFEVGGRELASLRAESCAYPGCSIAKTPDGDCLCASHRMQRQRAIRHSVAV